MSEPSPNTPLPLLHRLWRGHRLRVAVLGGIALVVALGIVLSRPLGSGDELVLESVPNGAEVYLNGRFLGRTPLVVAPLPDESPLEVQLRAPDYEPGSWTLGRPRGRQVLTLELQPIARPVGSPFATVVGPPTPTRGVATATVAPSPMPTPTSTPATATFAALPEGAPEAVAVVVENSAFARPQSGLQHANVVYEALAEGGISRFLAIYLAGADDRPIGPVRSARHYFVQMAMEYGAPLAHVSASPQAYELLRSWGYPHLEETREGSAIWRTSDRAAPHNAYTSTAALRRVLERRGIEAGQGAGGLLARSVDAKATGDPVTEFTLDYTPWPYQVSYRYDQGRRSYVRWVDGDPHVDADTGEQIEVSAVVVLFVPTWPIPRDTAGRLDMQLTGEGSAVVFRDGHRVTARWRRASLQEPTTLVDDTGQPIQFDRSPVWVQYAPPSAEIRY